MTLAKMTDGLGGRWPNKGSKFFFPPPQMPPRVLTDLVVLPPGHGSSVTDF